MTSEADDAELRRLRWRCRRGMRELDQLMLRYLDQRAVAAEEAAQAARSASSFLVSAIALAGFSPFGQTLAQFMIVWQR